MSSGRFTPPLDRLGYLKLAKHSHASSRQVLTRLKFECFTNFQFFLAGSAECADARPPPALPSPTLSPTTDHPCPSWLSLSRPTTTSVERRSRGKNTLSCSLKRPKNFFSVHNFNIYYFRHWGGGSLGNKSAAKVRYLHIGH